MSCHTWAYCKVKPEKEKKIRADLHKKLNRIWVIVPEGVNEEEYVDKKYNDLKNTYSYKDLTRDEVAEMIHKGNIKYRQYRSEIDTCDSKHLGEIIEDIVIDESDYIVHNSCIYEECAFDRPIRIYGYPEETFTDVDEFIEWVKKSEVEKGYAISEYYNLEDEKYVKGFDETAERLVRKFWEKYDNQVCLKFG